MHWGQNPAFYELGGLGYSGILSKYMTDFEVVNNFLYKTTPCEFSLYCIIINQTPGSVPPIMIPSAHTFQYKFDLSKTGVNISLEQLQWI